MDLLYHHFLFHKLFIFFIQTENTLFWHSIKSILLWQLCVFKFPIWSEFNLIMEEYLIFQTKKKGGEKIFL